MNILLLEDDKQLNKAISQFLTLKGLQVSSFYDGNDVIEQIGGYDLYLLDINTPNIDGIDILKYIHASSKSAKVIMISANINIEMIKNFLFFMFYLSVIFLQEKYCFQYRYFYLYLQVLNFH